MNELRPKPKLVMDHRPFGGSRDRRWQRRVTSRVAKEVASEGGSGDGEGCHDDDGGRRDQR